MTATAETNITTVDATIAEVSARKAEILRQAREAIQEMLPALNELKAKTQYRRNWLFRRLGKEIGCRFNFEVFDTEKGMRINTSMRYKVGHYDGGYVSHPVGLCVYPEGLPNQIKGTKPLIEVLGTLPDSLDNVQQKGMVGYNTFAAYYQNTPEGRESAVKRIVATALECGVLKPSAG